MKIKGLEAEENKGQYWIKTNPKEFKKIIKKLKDEKARLITISGLDDQKGMKTIYHFDLEKQIIHVIVDLDNENPTIPSIIQIFPNANLYERELAEMFNIKVTGHPNMKPLFLTKELSKKAPLRKDYQEKE